MTTIGWLALALFLLLGAITIACITRWEQDERNRRDFLERQAELRRREKGRWHEKI